MLFTDNTWIQIQTETNMGEPVASTVVSKPVNSLEIIAANA